MAGSQISTGVTIINSLKGFQAVSLTNYATSAATAIATGSVVEVAGAFFSWAGDETPTGWAGISTTQTAYIALTPSGTAGSQIVSASYTATAPTWRDDNQGWYASAGSSVRVVGGVYKTSATQYDGKFVYNGIQVNQDLRTTASPTFATINTGQGDNELYDMDQNVTTASNVEFNEVTCEVLDGDVIRGDSIALGGVGGFSGYIGLPIGSVEVTSGYTIIGATTITAGTIKLANIPTSAGSVVTGELYSDGGTIKIK